MLFRFVTDREGPPASSRMGVDFDHVVIEVAEGDGIVSQSVFGE
jgi:hypothetical protein